MHSASLRGAGVNQLATAGDTLPQAGQGKKEAVER